MNKDGIPLPSALSGQVVERLIRIDEALLFLVTGVLTELADDWHFEETGSLTSEGAKDAISAMLWCFMKECIVTPIASMVMWPKSAIPDGWLKCNGQAVSRTDYARLFAAIGTDYGAGDGSTTFNVPNFVDRSPFGVGGLIAVVGQTLGSNTHAITTSELPAHNHGVNDPGHTHGTTVSPTSPVSNRALVSTGGAQTVNPSGVTGSATTGVTTQNAGGGSSMSLLHAVLGVHVIIYAGG